MIMPKLVLEFLPSFLVHSFSNNIIVLLIGLADNSDRSRRYLLAQEPHIINSCKRNLY